MRGVLLFAIFLFLVPAVSAGVQEDAEFLQQKVTDFVGLDPTVLIIEGEHASFTERQVLSYTEENYPAFGLLQRVHESDVTPDMLNGRTIILVGGPKQSGLANYYLNAEGYSVEQDKLSAGIATFLEGEQGKVLIFSDHQGFENNRQTGAEKSPLAFFIPVQYVPAAAAGIGLSLLWLWNLIAKMLPRVTNAILANQVMKHINKKDIEKVWKGKRVLGVRLKLREWLAISAGATVLALSLGYLYLSPDTNTVVFFLWTIAANIIVHAVRNIARLLIDRHHGLHTEYKIWPYGAVITALTAWLGTTFSLAGYVSSREKNKREGESAFIVNFLTYLAFAILFAVNVINPGLIVQMAMLLAINITFIQMLPMTPFAGKKVFAWKKWVWVVSMIPLVISYVYVNLLI